MTRSRIASLTLVLAASAMLAACRHASAGAANGVRPPAGDSIVGVVRVTGVEVMPMVIIALDDGKKAVTLDGPASLRKVAGLRIVAIGEREGARLRVSQFTVIASGGVAATDGMLAREGSGFVLVTADGKRHALVNPALLLRENVGHRAWVSGPLDREPVAFGIID